MIRYLKQLIPLTYVSKYKVGKRVYVSIWKMWLGRTYKHRAFEIKSEVNPDTIFQ
ncbi:hypothetical protein [Clostridium sp.]|uniref:hypothetical protein n=1 Tax=Clostridium sp. TaxID=1506 RepID=UPI00290E1DB4|nr:hypothetical protein [Clostridium sp.]MDU3410984.1 hypothetical protein [Clostridium sp.]